MPPHSRTRRVVWALAVLGMVGFARWTLWPALTGNTYGFSAHYTAARLTLQGETGPRLCDDWFGIRQAELGLRPDAFCPNPPTLALLMAPVAWLPPRPARVAWILADLLMIAAVVWLGRRVAARAGLTDAAPSVSLPLTLIALACFQPLRWELHEAQAYTFLGLLYALWLCGYAAGRDGLCGAAMALLALAKLSGAPLWLLMVAARRSRGLIWALGVGVAGALSSLPLVGWPFWRAYLFEQLIAIPLDPRRASPAYQTLASVLRQCFVREARWSPAPLWDAPWLAGVLWVGLAAGLLAVTLWAGARDRTPWTALALLCLVVPLQPAGEQYHYAIVCVVVVVLVEARRELWRVRPALALALLGGALFAVPSFFLGAAFSRGGPWTWAAYPRLYAALSLWGACIVMRRRAVAGAA